MPSILLLLLTLEAINHAAAASQSPVAEACQGSLRFGNNDDRLLNCASSLESNQLAKCEVGWLAYSVEANGNRSITNRKCFVVHTQLNLKYEEAYRHCRRLGGTLPTIDSKAENDFLTELLFTRLQSSNDYWLGGKLIWQSKQPDYSDEDVNSVYVWLPELRMVEYFNWAPDQPNGHWIGLEQRCLELNMKYNYTTSDGRITYNWPAGVWNDIECHNRNLVVCQKVADKSYDGFATPYFNYYSASDADHIADVDRKASLDESAKPKSDLIALITGFIFACLLTAIIVIVSKKQCRLHWIYPPKPLFGLVLSKDNYEINVDKGGYKPAYYPNPLFADLESPINPV